MPAILLILLLLLLLILIASRVLHMPRQSKIIPVDKCLIATLHLTMPFEKFLHSNVGKASVVSERVLDTCLSVKCLKKPDGNSIILCHFTTTVLFQSFTPLFRLRADFPPPLIYDFFFSLTTPYLNCD